VTEYVYRVTEVVKVTDGDTFWLRVDVGFRALVLAHTRLNGYDTPERNSRDPYEREAAALAAGHAAAFLHAALADGDLWVKTYKDPDSFGRWLGDVTSGGVLLGESLRAEGLASLWPTRWREEFAATS
jgi:endonuclease YncB( thermonuclease family)